MICPFLVTFSKNLNINPLITLGIIGILGGISAIPLAETFGKELENEILEESVYKISKTFKKGTIYVR
jgi:hypothetical protein